MTKKQEWYLMWFGMIIGYGGLFIGIFLKSFSLGILSFVILILVNSLDKYCDTYPFEYPKSTSKKH